MQCCTCIQNTESTNSIQNPTMSHSQKHINMTLCDSYKCTKTGVQMLYDYSNSPKIYRKNSKLSISESPPFIKRTFSYNSSPSFSDNSSVSDSPSFSDNSSPPFSKITRFSNNSSPSFSKKFDRPILNYNDYLQKYKAKEILEKMFKQ